MTQVHQDIVIRRASDRGRTNIGWLDSFHSFSFGQYHDPRYAGFRSLRVINDDIIAPGMGFDEHGHRDMEILTWVLSGSLRHRDSLGHESVITPGELQVMTAGRGIRHSEFNASDSEAVHLLQIWIIPDQRGLEPRYDEKRFDAGAWLGRWCLLASGDGREGSIRIHQDADMHVSGLKQGDRVTFTLRPQRHAWVHVATGRVMVNGQSLSAGDAAAVAGSIALDISAQEPSELLLFDLA